MVRLVDEDMKLSDHQIEMKSIIVIFFALIATLLLSSFIYHGTSILPWAQPEKQPGQPFVLPAPLPMVNISPNLALPTPSCTYDEENCLVCCAVIDGQEICQDRTCPALKPHRLE